LAQNEYLFKFAYLCDNFATLNKLSMQGPDENMFDASDKIVTFIKKLSLWKEDIGNVPGTFSVLYFLV